MVKRRKFLIGLGSLAAGGAAAVGTGAFDAVGADRNVDADVVGDASAHLKLIPTSDYTSLNGEGALEINMDGVNPNAVTYVESLFAIQNNGTQGVEVRLQGAPNDRGRDAVQIPPSLQFGGVDLRDGLSNSEIDNFDPGSSTTVNPSRNGGGNFSAIYMWLDPQTAPADPSEDPYGEWDDPGEVDLGVGQGIQVSAAVAAAESGEDPEGELQIRATDVNDDYS